MSKENREFAIQVVAAIGAVILVIYGIIALLVGVTNAQNTMNWCQYKSGNYNFDDPAKSATGKRWSPNPATVGLTGECINPGDKGL